MDEYFSVVKRLPAWLAQPLSSLPSWQAAAVQEIRLRAGGPVLFTVGGRLVPAAQYNSTLAELERTRLTSEQLHEVLVEACGRSLHSYEEELQQGYVTLPGGHRMGVGGSYVRSGSGYLPRTVLALNLRIARHHAVRLPPGLSERLCTPFGGLALLGPPLSGKTTVLRGMAEQIGRAGRSCAVIDERDELFAKRGAECWTGLVDIVSGLPKADAVQLALRTLAPQVILLDELGEPAEVAALQSALYSGVDFIVTLHAGSLQEAEQKPQFRLLRRGGLLRTVCVLAGRSQPGVITEVLEL